MPELYKRKSNTKCTICGKEIYRRPIELVKTKGRAYCSIACYGISSRREKSCIICNKLILSSFHRITCSRECSNINRKGIKYHLGRPKDKAEEIRAIKIKLISIRGGKCEKCDYSKSEVLQVHHKDRNIRNNDFDNLEIICPNCHFENHYLEKVS